MRLGLIARADSRGLGIQSHGYFRNLHPAKTMVVDCPSAQPLTLHLDRFPGATVINGLPSDADYREFLDGIDVVLSAETFYNPNLFHIANSMSARSVLAPNYEFLSPTRQAHLYAVPSMWHYDDIPFEKTHLPVPIELDRFPVGFPTPELATRFLHIVGRPAVHDRNGTEGLLRALQYVTADITVTIRCQHPTHVPDLLSRFHVPGHVHLSVVSADSVNYWDAYTGQDVLVMPRRFGGLCLPVNEALGAGIPCVMPDISPNNTWLPNDWLVRASYAGSFRAHQPVDYFSVDHLALAAKIDRFATDTAFYEQAVQDARRLRDEYSWNTLKSLYRKVLGDE